jgi:hypothetical protein
MRIDSNMANLLGLVLSYAIRTGAVLCIETTQRRENRRNEQRMPTQRRTHP